MNTDTENNRKAILIGFEYKNGKKLPGIIVDIYLVYKFLKNINWKDSEILIYTDIEKDYQTEVLKTAILEKTVDSGILTFIEDSKEKNQYIEFKSHMHNFQTCLSNLQTYSFIYYSGHSKNGNLILPNNALISLDFFRDMLNFSKETLLVMDCCEGGINLPFVLHENIYRCNYNLDFVKNEIICLASCLENEKSVTSKAGSLFTKYLFKELENTSDITNLIKKVKKKIKTGNVLVSHPYLHYIFNWFYKFPNLKIILTPHFIEIKK